ncbi:hypothetical protein Droror1_Dr00017054 [Drosera rotundifolia]
MACSLHRPFTTLFFLSVFALLLSSFYSLSVKQLNFSEPDAFDSNWSPAVATWYGDKYGPGSTGGARGYGDTVRCLNGACSGNPVTVTITDSCPGCPEAFHFDLSSKACGGMAKPGQDNQLRNAGVIQVQYRRVPCYYRNAKIAVHVDQGSTPYYFAGAIDFNNGDGTLKSVALQQLNQGSWIAMQEAGVIWKLNAGFQLKPPFALRLTASQTGTTIVLQNVIPSGWQPSKISWSSTNF